MKGKSDSFFSIKYIARLFHTLRYLKWQQFFFRIYYPFKRIFFKAKEINAHHLASSFSQERIQFPHFSINNKLYNPEGNSFIFLNQSKSFSGPINWEFDENGLLWTFHLHYFDWLNDPDLSVEARLSTLKEYTGQYKNSYIFNHSYPASLRIINSIKFLIENEINNERIAKNLYCQASRLAAFPEYEIGANHLLVNGIALIWVGIYFSEPAFEQLGKNILKKELDIQVLNDGIHFEKSPAYQSIIVKDLMCLLILLRAKPSDFQFNNFLAQKCSLLLSGLSTFLTPDGFYMNFGDANDDMSVLYNELRIVAQNLPLNLSEVKLNESGYRALKSANFSLLFNLGNVISSYQPGHAHADAFSFCLNYKERQIIVDRGVSTYEKSNLRLEEKSTAAHNTICIEKKNTADVWSSFRMGRRAKFYKIENNSRTAVYEHDAYKKSFGIIHRRKFEIQEKSIDISDELKGWKNAKAHFFLHFHPDVELVREGKGWKIEKEGINIVVENCSTYLENYQYCYGFNKTKTAKRIVGNIHSVNIRTVINFFDGQTH